MALSDHELDIFGDGPNNKSEDDKNVKPDGLEPGEVPLERGECENSNDDDDENYETSGSDSERDETRSGRDRARRRFKHSPVSFPGAPTEKEVESSEGGGNSPPQDQQHKHYCCYVGNMTWWTTDEELESVVKEVLGATDLLDVKFYDDRHNGKSRGIAVLVFRSSTSARECMKKLTGTELNERKLICLPYTKGALEQLIGPRKRSASKERKRKPESTGGEGSGGTKNTSREQSQADGQKPPVVNFGTIHIKPGMPLSALPAPTNKPQPLFPPRALAQSAPMQNPFQGPSFPSAPNFPQPSLQSPGFPAPPTQMHINPAMYPGAQLPSLTSPLLPHSAQLPSLAPPPFPFGQIATGLGGGNQQRGMLTERDVDEMVQRNQVVCSSAISRSVGETSAGDYMSAIETLATAITLIRSSPIASDRRSQLLVTTLQDTLAGVKEQDMGGGYEYVVRGGSKYTTSSSGGRRIKREPSEERPSSSSKRSKRHTSSRHSSKDRLHSSSSSSRHSRRDKHRNNDQEYY